MEFYFATPHHGWERGTNEHTNGLIRQYLPKRTSMAHIDRADLDAIAHKLNTRPRMRLASGLRRNVTHDRRRSQHRCCTSNLKLDRLPSSASCEP